MTPGYPLLGLLAVFLFSGCGNLPGRPSPSAIPVDPGDVTDFNLLYNKNCSGCHGAAGQGGAALDLGDPVYLAIVDDSTLRDVVSNGIPGTSMAAFAKSAGGMLTDSQVNIIVRGIRQRYSKPNALAGANPPPYAAKEPGDPKRGADVYKTFCASCHGPDGKGASKAGSIVDGSFLALLTDRELRTLTIVGRPDLGAPDWRNNVPGKPMTPQEISDVVAWLSSQRPQFSGRPYPSVAKAAGALP
ncbi:MAG TPA: c-type cytochrome [Candidatus Eremiobacteraceae bacterium]|nr:c-type cytochrome [Candidatus Eremiobacteraceae bacterium]